MQIKLFLPGVLLVTANFAISAPASDAASAGFQLKTVVTAGNPNKNNLYVFGYHTGAGTADAVLSPELPSNQVVRLANTTIQFDYGTNTPAYLNTASDTNYAFWDSVGVDQVYGPTYGFYFNNSASKVDGLGIGLKWNPNYPYAPPPDNDTGIFGGWLACDWWHQSPQLFWIVRYDGSNNTLIDTCSKVELIRA